MDKKLKYTQSSTKGTGPGDAKKNQDVVNGSKVFAKNSRRRESTGASGYSKNEQQSRKSNVQKTRSFDKRPKPKGLYYGGPKEDTKVEEEEAAELSSVMVPGSKKQNLNHLLNFHYAPRDVTNSSGEWNCPRSRGNYNNNNRWLPPIQRHKYNKEQFLQANCQFVVNNDGDYEAHLVDPDTLVDWKFIEQIRIHSSGNLSCPICLCPPVAGKMTRCGHVYCWPCILHYLALSDKAWRKCPICYESVRKADLKSVVEVTQNHLNIGDRVKLRLMRRERGSLIAVPVQEVETMIPSTFVSVSEANSHEFYSKLLLADVSDIMDIIESERVQLNLEIMEDPNSSENCFIEQALADLSAREQQVSSFDSKRDVNPETNEHRVTTDISTETKNAVNRTLEKTQSLQDDNVTGTSSKDSDMTTDGEATSFQNNSARFLSKFFYFYQAEDGQHLYLHAMNVKMLELQYGNLENCPRSIWGKILEKETGSFTEELRRRMRYLYHLPLTCTFEIAEIELGPPLITDEVLGHFAEQVQNREKRRRRRERDERKREKKITAEENKRMGRFTTPKVHIESHKHFPQWQPENKSMEIRAPSPVSSTTSANSPTQSNFLAEIDSAASAYNLPPESCQDQTGPSFAQMLQNKGLRVSTNRVAWPSIDVAEPRINRSNPSTIDGSELEEDAYAVAPSFNQSFCDDLAQTFDNTDFLPAGNDRKDTNLSGKKKKKKCKTTVLFATSMSRAS